jgi:hypothetical protein
MDIRIAGQPDIRFKFTTVIPIWYCKDIGSFSKPYVRLSPLVDILCNEYSSSGYTFRKYVFYVKERIELLTSISSPKVSITSLLLGNSINIRLNNDDNKVLNQGEYILFLQHTNEVKLSLYRGTYIMLRCDYSPDKISKYSKNIALYADWLKIDNSGISNFLNKEDVKEELWDIFKDLEQSNIITADDHNRFFEKLRYILMSVFITNGVIN